MLTISPYSRPAIVLILICLSLITLQVLFNPLDSIKPSRILRGQASLKSILVEEEAKYKVALEGREGLVRKWGPTDEDIVAFPKNGQMFTVWDFFIPAFRCPHRVERIGTLGDGGKWFCGVKRYAQQRAPCVFYSFGINGESSFEAALLKDLPHCEVWGYDFSVSSFGPEVEADPALQARAHFFPYALGSEDAPHNHPPTYTLQTLMEMNGHDFIDILKIDIESAEFGALTSFVNHFVPRNAPSDAVLPVGQLQVEIHFWDRSVSFATFRRWWENLERAGLRPFWTEPNLLYLLVTPPGTLPDLTEYSFMNVRANYALTDDDY